MYYRGAAAAIVVYDITNHVWRGGEIRNLDFILKPIKFNNIQNYTQTLDVAFKNRIHS